MNRSVYALIVCLVFGCGGAAPTKTSSADWEPAKKRDIRVSLIKTLVDAKAYTSSVPLLRQALAENPSDARLHYMMGAVLRERSLYEQAVVSFEEAIRLAPRFAEAHSGLAMTFNLQGKHDAALLLHEKAVGLNPSDARLLNNYGFALSLLNQHERAIKAYKSALKLDPNQQNTYVNLGFSLALTDKEAEAKKAFGQVLRDAQVLNNLALARELRGDHTGAAALYTEALEVDPSLDLAQENIKAVQEAIEEDGKVAK